MYKYIALCFVLVFISACKDTCDFDVTEAGEEVLAFRVVDPQTNESLIKSVGGKYVSDQIDIRQEDGSASYNLEVRSNGTIFFSIDPNLNADAIGKPLSSTFYLHFNDSIQVGQVNDIDTIAVEYAVEENRCKHIVFSAFQVQYNGFTYDTGNKNPSFIAFKK